MRRSCWSRLALAAVAAGFAALASLQPAIAAPAGLNHYLQSIDLPPQCPTSASDAPVCQVAPAQLRPSQATSLEYVLFRIGWSDAMKASCDAFVRNTTTTITVDGQAEPIVTEPCQLVANFNGNGGPYWVTDSRYLSAPLSPGTYTVVAKDLYHAPVPYWTGCKTAPPCYSKPGEVDTFQRAVTVVFAAPLATPPPRPAPSLASIPPAGQPKPTVSGSGPVNPLQSSLATSLVAPAAAFASLRAAVINAAIVVALVLFVTFPSLLFNSTYDQNHARIQSWWEKRFRWTNRLRQRAQRVRSSRRGLASFAAVAVVGSVLGGLLDPRFGVNSRTAALVIGILLAIVTGTVVYASASGFYRRVRGDETRWELRALPTGLIVAALCVFISRVTGYLPGYLYGVIGGVAFAGQLAKQEEGHVVAVSSAAVLVTSVVAWLLWVPVTTAASQPGAGFAWALLQNFLAAVFVSGLVGLVIGLVPLRFLPGEKLAAWHRGIWFAVFAVAAFALLQIMLRPQSTTAHVTAVPFWTTLGLFLAFGTASVVFWGYFRLSRQ